MLVIWTSTYIVRSFQPNQVSSFAHRFVCIIFYYLHCWHLVPYLRTPLHNSTQSGFKYFTQRTPGKLRNMCFWRTYVLFFNNFIRKCIRVSRTELDKIRLLLRNPCLQMLQKPFWTIGPQQTFFCRNENLQKSDLFDILSANSAWRNIRQSKKSDENINLCHLFWLKTTNRSRCLYGSR